MEWMQVLVLIHVLSAIIGVGPTFFGHVLVRKNQTVEEFRNSATMSARLEYFPKIGGSLAVLTGILLVVLNNYGSFMQLWLIGSLIIYIAIQIVVIALVSPNSKMLISWVNDPANKKASEFPEAQRNLLTKVSNLYSLASALGILLFAFMILKP